MALCILQRYVYRTFHKYITSYSICMSEMKGRGSLKQVSTWDDEPMTIITRVYRLVSRTVKCNAYCNRQKYTSVKLFNVVKIKILKIWYQEHSNNISTLYTALLVLSTEWKSRFISFQTFLYKTEILFKLGKHTLFFFLFAEMFFGPQFEDCVTQSRFNFLLRETKGEKVFTPRLASGTLNIC